MNQPAEFYNTSARAKDIRLRLSAFMDEHIYPSERIYRDQGLTGDRWQPRPIVEDLKTKAKVAELWNLFLPESEQGAGLTNLEYAPLCEIMADAAHAILIRNSRECTGNFFVDDDVLRSIGITCLDDYSVVPGAPLQPDFFVTSKTPK